MSATSPSSMPDPTAGLSPLKRAFLALEEAQARVAALEQAAREPIAIIGLGCRVPGANGVDAFWQLLRDGVDAISPVPGDRWDVDAYFDPDPATPGKIAARRGGFLSDVDRFDASFFGIAPREAQGMDPQQRLILEVAWEALEHAGQAADRLRHSPTGVYVGVCSSDYSYLQIKTGNESLLDAHFTSGIAHSITSGRLSYLLGLRGPSLTLDTACSSSLVAVHLAVQALRGGECRLALAGGVNLILAPDLFVALSHAHMLAPDGRCKTFDAAADGFARGEGCGMVVLKRLSDALADGDRVLAIVRGTSVNQDGASSGLTAPNGPAQEAVIRGALANGGVAPHHVGYVEAHGTGTELGDPLEAHALGSVFAERRGAPPLVIGSVKTNIGHLEAAAGVVGLIKLVLALRHQSIPPHLHFETPSPHIDWARMPLRVPAQAEAWTAIEGRRVGGVSSFGFSGTNAHVVVEEAPAAPIPIDQPQRTRLFAISARDPRALTDLAAQYTHALAGRADEELADVCYTANHGRTHFTHRATIATRSIESLRTALSALARGEEASHLRIGEVTRRDPPTVAFLFTGQGSQYVGMACGLYERAPAFRDALDRCAEGLAPYLDIPLLDLLFASDARTASLDDTIYTQPAIFALEYALSRLWHAWGVAPTMVIGHSVGELVAACVAGVFELDDALRLVARRGRLMGSLPAGGAMAAIAASEPTVTEALGPYAERVSVAAINGPAQTVISGAAPDVAAICRTLEARGVKTQSLPVSHAFHSPLVEPILDAFEREVAQLRLSPPRIRLISNVTGAAAAAGVLTTPAYWRRHLRDAVRFEDGLRALAVLRPDVAIEIGPHPTLLAFAGAVFGNDGPLLRASLRKGHDDWDHLLQTLADVHLAGVAIDWRAQAETAGAPAPRVTDLPTYPFQRERHWIPIGGGRRFTHGTSPAQSDHALLGTRLQSPALTASVWESTLTSVDVPYLYDHRVRDTAIMPAVGFIEIADAAGRAHFGSNGCQLTELLLREPLVLPESGARVLQTVLTRIGDQTALQIFSAAEEPTRTWTEHVAARLQAPTSESWSGDDDALAAARLRCHTPVAIETFRETLLTRGLRFGPAFLGVQNLWAGPDEALGRIVLPETLEPDSAYIAYPPLLDACIQVLAAPSLAPPNQALALYVPLAIDGCAIRERLPRTLWSHARLRESGAELQVADLRIFDDDARLVARVDGLRLRKVTGAMGAATVAAPAPDAVDALQYEVQWRPLDIDPPDSDGGLAVVLRPLQTLARNAAAESTIREHHAFLARLEAICPRIVVETLRACGIRLHEGDELSDRTADQAGIAPEHRRLWRRLLEILAEAALLSPLPIDHERHDAGGAWRVVTTAPEGNATRELAALAEARASGPELTIVQRTASTLARVLTGAEDPLAVLFPGGSADLVDALYRQTPTARLYQRLAQDAVGRIVASQKHSAQSGAVPRPIRVLEVGGGTASMAEAVLEALPAGGFSYTFTDVSPLLVARATERLSHRAEITCRVLDIERDPMAQQMPRESFDLVIASNVVHATRDLEETLGHLRTLLAPNGALVLLEVTAPQRWVDLSFGMLDGWWRFTDIDRRPSHPLLPASGWLALLRDCGFEDATCVPDGEDDELLALQALIVARGARLARPRGDVCIVGEADGIGAALRDDLEARGARVRLLEPGADAAAFSPDVHELVYLSALDSAPEDSASTQQALIAPLLQLCQKLVRISRPPRLSIITRGAQAFWPDGHSGQNGDAAAIEQSTLWGFTRSLAHEHPDLRPRCIDLDLASNSSAPDAERIARTLLTQATDAEIVWRGGKAWTPRLARRRTSAKGEPPAVRLVAGEVGRIDALAVVPITRRPPADGEIEIEVRAAALNFRDLANVLDLRQDAESLGSECAGVVSAIGAGVSDVEVGDAVIAIASGSFASFATTSAAVVVRKPEGMSFEDAAGVPIAWLTADQALNRIGRLQRGERVLIHAAAGGVGLAAVRLAQQRGAEVFATAGTERKRAWLRGQGVAHVMDSRSLTFADELADRTRGVGMDVALNSLAGAFIPATLGTLARGGRFLEIGKNNIWTRAEVSATRPDVEYTPIDLSSDMAAGAEWIAPRIREILDDLQSGRLAPLPRRVFPLGHAHDAFRCMAQARHIGKVVLTAGADRRAFRANPHGTYTVTGGCAGLGLLVAEWLADRGARTLVLMGRSRPDASAERRIARLREQNITVVVHQGDVSDAEHVARLDDRLRGLPPLRGVVHAAGVLDDGVVSQQSWSRFESVFAPKIFGTRQLERLVDGRPLDFFVLFSSVAALAGAPGQSNHAAANAWLDAFAHARTAAGLPTSSINWGAWDKTGAALRAGVRERIEARGGSLFDPSLGLAAFERVLLDPVPQVAVLSVDWARQGREPGRLFSELVAAGPIARPSTTSVIGEPAHKGSTKRGEPALVARLDAAPADRRTRIVDDYVQEQARRVLGIARHRRIDPHQPLTDLGMDSLMAVEFRNVIAAAVDRPLSSTLLFEHPTIDALTRFLVSQLGVGDTPPSSTSPPALVTSDPSGPAPPSIGAADVFERMEQLSDEEIDRLFSTHVEAAEPLTDD